MAWEGSLPLSSSRRYEQHCPIVLITFCFLSDRSVTSQVANDSQRFFKKSEIRRTPRRLMIKKVLQRPLSRLATSRVFDIVAVCLGTLFYWLVARRRQIALENLRHAIGGERNEREIKQIARRSCQTFFLIGVEILRFRFIWSEPDVLERLRQRTENLDELIRKAKKIHEQSGGCIFVTPHIGFWEHFPQVSALAGIPLTIVVRPLDNPFLERLIYRHRSNRGQVIVPKRNAFFYLKKALRQGKSLGILPDQSTSKGISVDFFGRKAKTTPAPAILATMYHRPIVVTAICRKEDRYHYEGFVSDPIWPGEYESEKAEIFRLTEKMNKEMEFIIRKYPEQYLWIHNRWKTYGGHRDLFELGDEDKEKGRAQP